MFQTTISKSLINNIHWLLIILSVLCNALLAAVLFYFVFLSPDVGAQPNITNTNTWSTNGTVYDIDVGSDGTIYLGGSFSYVGPNTGYAVLASVSSGELSTYPTVLSTGSSNFLRKIISDGSGGWYIAGGFTSVDGVARTGLARITSSGALDTTFNPDFGSSATIYGLLLQGSTLYVGGSFSTVNGVSQNGIAAVSATTGASIEGFTASMAQTWDTVYTMAIDNGILYLGGNFSGIGSDSRNSLAAVNLSDSSVANWNPDAGSFSTVYDMAVTSSVLYVGGGFTSIGGTTRNYIAAINTSTGIVTDWNPNSSGYVYDLELDGDNVYVAGDFSTIGGESRTKLAAIDSSTGSATSWSPSIDNTVYDLDIYGDTVYVAGSFLTVGGSSRARVASVSKSTGEVGSLNLVAGAAAYAIETDGTGIYIGGDFKSIGGALRNNLAAFNSATGQATSWNPNVNNTVKAVEADSSIVYIGGSFTEVGGTSRSRLAAINTNDGSLTSWDPAVGGFDGVNDIELDGSTLYVGGGFTSIGGDSRNYLAAIDTSTGSSTSWWPDVTGGSSGVKALSVSSTVVYIGGDFTSIGGDSRNYLAAVDKTTGSSTSWNPNPAKDFASPTVDALAVDGPLVYAGGNFTSIGGASRNYLAAFNGETVTDWDPNPTMVCGFCERFTRIVPTSSLVYVAGAFTAIGGGSSNAYLAAIDKTTGLATSWAPEIPSGSEVVRSMAFYNSVLYIGGSLTAVNSALATGFAQFGPITLGFASTSLAAAEATTSTSFTVGITNGVTSTQNISVAYSVTGGTATGGGTDYTLSSGTATITAGQSSTTIPLVVVADTSIEADETLILTLSSPSGARLGDNTASTYTIQNDDTATPGVTVSESASSTAITESGTTDTYTLVLNSEPSANVTITLTTSTQVSASVTTLTFTSINWETPQTVTTTAVNDDVAEGTHTGLITHVATSDDGSYNGIVVSSVVPTITDNDTAGVTVTQSDSNTAVSESGLSDTFTVVLTSEPTSTVSVVITGGADLSFSSSTLTFTADTWDTAKTVTVSAVNDALVESLETASISFTVNSTDSNYSNFSVTAITATITDNDTASAPSTVTVAPPSVPVVVAPVVPQVVETKTLSEATPVAISVGGSSHSVSLVSYSPRAATIVIRSEPIILTVENGVPSEVDVDRNGVMDLRVVYLGEIDGKPEFEFISLLDATEKDRPISVNGGAYSTRVREVTVRLNAKEVVLVALSHTPDFAGAEFVPYSEEFAWVIPDGVGEKKVYARLRSASGGLVDVSDTIIYDPSSILAGTCPLESGFAYRSQDSKEVYYILDSKSPDRFNSLFSCTRRLFQTPEVYFSYFESWDETRVVDSAILNAVPNDGIDFIPWGPLYRVKNGALLKTITDPKVYFILGPNRHWVTSEGVFNSLNFVWDSVEDSANLLINRFKSGSDIVTPADVPPGAYIRFARDPNNIYFLQRDASSATTTWKRPVQKASLLRRLLKSNSIITVPSEVYFPDGAPLK